MFGKRLRELRDIQNLSMDRMVELYNEKFNAKMNKSTLSRYENGLQNPIYTVVKNLADFFNVPVDYLSGNEKDPDIDSALLMHNLDGAIRQQETNTYIIHGSEGKGAMITSNLPKDKYLLVGEGNISELTKKEYSALKSVLEAMNSLDDE